MRRGWTVISGVAGSGKTRTLLRHAGEELGRGRQDEVLFVAFTRAAVKEAKARVGHLVAGSASDDPLPWWRTIHSTALRLLQETDDVQLLQDSDYRAFGERYGYRFSPTGDTVDDAPEVVVRTEGDALRAADAWIRSHSGGVPRPVRCPYSVNARALARFSERLAEYKRETGKIDFLDLLELVLERGLRPPVTVGFLDEAQDLSPQQIRVVELWMSGCSRVYVAGDPAQSIYAFQGASPAYLRQLTDECEHLVTLPRSHRVPGEVHRLARVVLHGDRAEAGSTMRPGAGSISAAGLKTAANQLDQLFDGKTALALARNWRSLTALRDRLLRMGTPFEVVKHPRWSPLTYPGLVDAYHAARAILDRRPASASGLAWLGHLCEAGSVPADAMRVLEHTQGHVKYDDLATLGLGRLVELMEAEGPVEAMTRVPKPMRRALATLVGRWGADFPQPRLEFSSIHSAKGREADLVVLLAEMSAASYEALQRRRTAAEEHRLAYVAVTRTKDRLVIVPSQNGLEYPYGALLRRLQAESV